jgi:hypothetical protein
MKPNDLIDYFTSIQDYTIITINDNNKDLYNHMINNTMKVYYLNLNNITDNKIVNIDFYDKEIYKNNIFNILVKKYKNLNSSEYLWIFYKGFLIGSREDIYKVINNKDKDKNLIK